MNEIFTIELKILRCLTKTEAMIFYFVNGCGEKGTSPVEIKNFIYNNRIIGSNSVTVIVSRMKKKLLELGYEYKIEGKRSKTHKIIRSSNK